MQGDSIVGFISGPSVSFWFMHSVHNLFKSDNQHRFLADFILAYGPYIHTNRNQLQEQFMRETDREWMFMVDNDMVFVSEDVWALFRSADVRGPGVYSAPYLMENGAMVCGTWDDEREDVYHPLVRLPTKPTEIGVVGAGFTLIHRDVFSAIGPGAFWPIYDSAGEDVSFSYRAAEAGFTPVLVPECNPGHQKIVTLYPHEQVRNSIGEEINLVRLTPALKAINEELMGMAELKSGEEVTK